jgi:DNA-binding beta-propeller fold protein YncE
VNRREFLLAAAAAPAALRHAVASAPVALVTCDEEERLSLVDLRTFRIVGSIRTLPDPRSIETVGARAVVCHTAVGAVSIVDRERVLHVLHDFVEPRYTAAHPDGVHAFVTDSGRSGVALVDVRRGVVVRRVRLSGWARHLTISPDGARLWVGLGSASAHVSVVDTHSFRHVRDLTPGFPAHDVGYAPDGRLWITSGSERVLAVDETTQAADLAPQHVTFGNGRVFVTSGDSGTLHVHAPTGRLVAQARVPVGSYNVQFGRGRVITPSLSRGTLAVFDGAGRALTTVHVAGSCHDACVLG